MRYFRLAYISGSSASAAKHAEEVEKHDIINRQLRYERSSKEEAYVALDLLKSDLAAARADVAEKDAEIERLKQERENWIETAAQAQRGIDYYQGLLDKIGESFGEAAHICDDGGHSESVLRAKLPELVIAAREREEKLVSNIEKPLCMGLSIFSGDDGVWLYFKTKNGNSQCLNISSKFGEDRYEYNPTLLQWAKEVALAAYDASRAADKGDSK